MTLNLVAWNETMIALASDQRVVALKGTKTEVVDDERVKIITLECSWPGRFGWSFNGLAEIEGTPTTRWMAKALFDGSAWDREPDEFCADLAAKASSIREFRRVDWVHTFVLAGWNRGTPAIGIVHNGTNPGGSGRRADAFRTEFASDPQRGRLTRLGRGRVRARRRHEASHRSRERGTVRRGPPRSPRVPHPNSLEERLKQRNGRKGVAPVYIPRDGSATQMRTHFPTWETSRIELPVVVRPGAALGVSFDLGESIRFQTPAQQRAIRRSRRRPDGG